MTGSPAMPQGMPPAAPGVAREQAVSDDVDGAIGGATEETSFRDLLSELEGGKSKIEASSTSEIAAPGNGRVDTLPLSPLQRLIADAEPFADSAGESDEDSQKPSSALPVSLLQLLAIAPAAIGSVTETPQPAEEKSAKALLDALNNALEGEKSPKAESSSTNWLDRDGKLAPIFPTLKSEDIEAPAPLPSPRLGAPATGARAGDAVHIKMAVLGQETHLPVLATQAQDADLQARAAAAIQKAYSLEADAAGSEEPPAVAEGTEVKTEQGPAVSTQPVLADSEEDTPMPVSRPNADSADRQKQETQIPVGTTVASAARAAEGTPSSVSTPVSQIARQIVADLATERPAASTSSGGATERTATGPGGSVLRVLHIKLEPETLGSITVRVSLKDNVITLDLSAARHETALVIEKDREALSSALKSAGYLVDGITSQTGETPRPNSQLLQPVNADAQSSFSASAQSQSGLSQSGRQGGGQGQAGAQSGNGFLPVPGVNENHSGESPKAGGALYV